MSTPTENSGQILVGKEEVDAVREQEDVFILYLLPGIRSQSWQGRRGACETHYYPSGTPVEVAFTGRMVQKWKTLRTKAQSFPGGGWILINFDLDYKAMSLLVKNLGPEHPVSKLFAEQARFVGEQMYYRHDPCEGLYDD